MIAPTPDPIFSLFRMVDQATYHLKEALQTTDPDRQAYHMETSRDYYQLARELLAEIDR